MEVDIHGCFSITFHPGKTQMKIATVQIFVYDVQYGLFQMIMGWGHIEIPEEHKEKAVEIFRSYKNSLTE